MNNKKPNEILWEELRFLRQRPQKQSKKRKAKQTKRPVAAWMAEDRLYSGKGKELCAILKTRACTWARSKSGGCTMCGYYNDRGLDDTPGEDIYNQIQSIFKKFEKELNNPNENIAFKIFNSGSFMDPQEIPREIQHQILAEIAAYPSVKEIIIESLPQFITETALNNYKTHLNNKWLEIGVGLETANDYIRTNIINKPFSWKKFEETVSMVQERGWGIRTYLLFKPPFLSELNAIYDLIFSIQECLKLGVNTISINPTNIQNHTICSQLENENCYRSPWYYSLFMAIKASITQEELESCRIICAPSGQGSPRGIHNCRDRSCNTEARQHLEKFVLEQDLGKIPTHFDCSCYNEWKHTLY